MQDFFGNMLMVGDQVAVTPHGYKNLVLGTVVGFTPKMVRVAYMRSRDRRDARPAEVLRLPTDLVKKPAQMGNIPESESLP